MENEKTKILNEYIKSAIIQGEATCEGDHKKANKNTKKLSKIYKKIESENELANELLTLLLNNENINVKIWAASHALGLKIEIDKAERILKQISNLKDIGILSFNAEMTLKTWKNQGFLKFH